MSERAEYVWIRALLVENEPSSPTVTVRALASSWAAQGAPMRNGDVRHYMVDAADVFFDVDRANVAPRGESE